VLDPGASEVPNYYATNILFDGQGRCILLGWVRGFPPGRGWNGCLALPRILTIGADGHPRQQPVPELAQLRKDHFGLHDLPLTGSPQLFSAVQGDTLELQLRLKPGGAQAVDIQLRRSTDGTRATTIRYDGRLLTVAGTEVPLVVGDEALDLHIYLDKSVLELFAQDGRVAVTRVIKAQESDQDLALIAEGGVALLESMQVWTMQPIW
jgi:beta-fructofuranosidase